jgi:uncharacterized protein (DUF488 family)
MNDPTTPRVLTVGHSTHPIDEFLDLLRSAAVTCVVDIRTLPGSRHNPQFNQESLAPSLEDTGIAYVREERLGGLRRASHTVASEVNGLWRNQSFHRYADHALTGTFAEGLDRLIELAAPPQLPAIMCSEAVWWRCHRRIVADHLLVRDVAVAHLMPDGRLAPATLTPGARAHGDRTVTYPAD